MNEKGHGFDANHVFFFPLGETFVRMFELDDNVMESTDNDEVIGMA